MAEGVLREELKLRGVHRDVRVDSAGTHATQPGHPADGRAQQACAREGADLRRSRARQVVAGDFATFDHILAMDERNQQWLLQNRPAGAPGQVSLLGSWAGGAEVEEIPDPYFGSPQGFDEVLRQIHASVEGFLPQLLALVDSRR